MSRYNEAKKIYNEYGVDTEAALEKLRSFAVSVHCWQGDDVIGFDNSDSLSGGIQTTGNYPGRARTPEELFADIKREIVKAVSTEVEPVELEFPAVMEKSCKRVEDAAKYLQRMRSLGLVSDYLEDDILGKDAHTVVTTVNDIEEFIKSI
jgi:L-rhamnose isomerase